MQEKVKQILNRLLEIWKKYTKRQKTIIISAVATVFLMLIILTILLNRIQYEDLNEFSSTETAVAAIDLLNEAGVENQLRDDGVTVAINAAKHQDALMALTQLADDGDFTISQLLDNDMSTTSVDKQLKNHLYLQSNLRGDIEEIEGVEKASILYLPTDNRGSILQEQKEISCSVMLTINNNFNTLSTPQGIATIVAYALGNATTDKIKVIDQYGNLLFGGPEEDENEASLNKTLAYKKDVEKWYKEKMFQLAVLNGYSYAEIVPSLDVNCDQESVLFTEYLAAEGQDQGLYESWQKITSESTGTTGDIPGTDSNDDVDYYIQTGSGGDSSYEETNIKYVPSVRVTETMKEWGAINNENSSLAITLNRSIERTENELETLGLLEGTTYDQYVLENSDAISQEVDEVLYQLFSDASGIPAANITITSYLKYTFLDDSGSGANWPLYLQILLAVLIVGLLAYVIFRASKPQEVLETEPELSVERLLATTKENQSLEDIEFSDKSETRKMIEKYIDENPEAVAALLRNWLNDDGWD